MAGLIPVRRTVEEIERANDELLRRHQEQLQKWIAERRSKTLNNHTRFNDLDPLKVSNC
jgi:hypothetical protein